MSQFFIFQGKPSPSVETSQIKIKSINESDLSLKKAIESIKNASALEEYSLVVDAEKDTSDFLFTEAQSELIEGKKFEDTRLFHIIMELYKTGTSLYFWYSTDSSHLPVYTDIETLLHDIKIDIQRGPCEFYGKIEIKK